MSTPQAPVDPDVKVPASVKAAVDAANALHAQAYPTEVPPATPPNVTPPAPTPEPPPAPAAAPTPPATPPAPPTPAPEVPPPAPTYPDKNAQLSSDEWRNNYLAMRGRFEQAQQTIGGMQEQLHEISDELIRTQAIMRQMRPSAGAAPTMAPAPAPQSGITDEDVKTFGPELLDTIQRVSLAAVQPIIAPIHGQIQQVVQRVGETVTGGVYQTLTNHVPNWRDINVSAEFKRWCALRDVYSGVVRGDLLNSALQAGDAARVVAFFKGFLSEVPATGQPPAVTVETPPPAPGNPPPRTPALSLEALAAPGRAKPASGDPAAPADKPVFTRPQIAKFYRDVREGHYAGREQEKLQIEQALFAAQHEGRIQ